MDRKDKILQIVENSGCLSKSQFSDLLHHRLHPDELRVVELHLSACTICSDALDGFELFPDSYDTMQQLTISILNNKKNENTSNNKNNTNKSITNNIAINNSPQSENAHKKTTNSLSNLNGNRLNINFKNSIVAIGIVCVFALLLWALVFSNNKYSKKEKSNLEQIANNNIATDITEDNVTENKEPSQKITPKSTENITVASVDTIVKEKMKLDSIEDNKTAIVPKTENPIETNEPKTEVEKTESNNKQEVKVAAQPTNTEETKKENIADNEKPHQNNQNDYENAVTLFRESKYASALLYFQSEMNNTNSPKYWDAMYYAALCHKNMNNKDKATAFLQKIIDAKVPQSSQANRILEELQ